MYRSGLLAIFVLLIASCGSDPLTPAERTVAITTTACGHASATKGVGVGVADGRVLTTAHTVSGAGEITVDLGDRTVPATIVRYSPGADLALLDLGGADTVEFSEIELATPMSGDAVVLSLFDEPARSVVVTRRVTIRIDGVRSSVETDRPGLEIDHRVDLGDSGAGVFVEDQLAGIVFGRSTTHDDRCFVVRADAIADILGSLGDEEAYICDPEQHRIVPVS